MVAAPLPFMAISIHAPRVGSDYSSFHSFSMAIISIHAPRVGSDINRVLAVSDNLAFQSTLPVWGATIYGQEVQYSLPNFNPRSPCGERPEAMHTHILGQAISIHAPRVGSDSHICEMWPTCTISIHAPRVGSDAKPVELIHHDRNFNPRSPCGERPLRFLRPEPETGNFNPRSPCGERLLGLRGLRIHRYFNPRSPCGERQ